MKVRITMELSGQKIDDVLEGTDANDLLSQAKARVAKSLGWKGLFLNAMTPLAFAQRAVALYNEAHHTQYNAPQSADEFLHLGQDLGYITLLQDT
jgi:hypothetical protein